MYICHKDRLSQWTQGVDCEWMPSTSSENANTITSIAGSTNLYIHMCRTHSCICRKGIRGFSVNIRPAHLEDAIISAGSAQVSTAHNKWDSPDAVISSRSANDSILTYKRNQPKYKWDWTHLWCYIHQTTTIKASQSAWIVIIQDFTIKPNTHSIQTLKSFLPIFLQVQAASRGELLSSRSSNIVGTTTTSSTLSSTTYNFLI